MTDNIKLHRIAIVLFLLILFICTERAQDFLSIFTRGDLTTSVSGDKRSDDVGEPLSSTMSPLTQTCTPERERSSPRRPDRPMTLSRPLQLPTCCNFRRQPWRTYVHGEFSYATGPRCYGGVDNELGTAADNDAVVKIIESLQITDKQLCSSNGCHGDDINNQDAENLKREERILQVNGSEGNNAQTDSNDTTSQTAQKNSPEVATVQITPAPLSASVKDTSCSNGILAVNGMYVDSHRQQNGKKQTVHSGCSLTRQMKEDINQNLRPLDGAKHVVPETKSHCQTGTGNSRQRSESPATGRQQKSKSRRSRNRSLASRDERLTNGGAERHQNQNGSLKSMRSRTLSPALTERFDYHVSIPVHTDLHKPEIAQRDVTVTGFDSPGVSFRPGVHRKSRGTAVMKGVDRSASPAHSQR